MQVATESFLPAAEPRRDSLALLMPLHFDQKDLTTGNLDVLSVGRSQNWGQNFDLLASYSPGGSSVFGLRLRPPRILRAFRGFDRLFF